MKDIDICQRIKQLRTRKKMTIKEWGSKIKLTQGYLSRIENSDIPPPIPTLLRIGEDLGVHIFYFLEDENSRNGMFLTRKNERKEIIRDFSSLGYIFETLAHKKSDKIMDPLILTLPRKLDLNALPYMCHGGEEFLYVLQGGMIFFYDEKEYRVNEGDCIYFDPSISHKGVCSTENSEVKLLMVLSPYTTKNLKEIRIN